MLGRNLRYLGPETDEWLRIAGWMGALMRRQPNECSDDDSTSVMSIV